MEVLFQPNLLVFGAALAVDFLWGEYPSYIHPVVWIGKAISFLESLAPRKERFWPLIMGIGIVLLISGGSIALLTIVFRVLSPFPMLNAFFAVFFLKATFALSALNRAALTVRNALGEEKVADARFGLRSLCSRDASDLDESDLIGATIESVAENLSDSFVAPLFYYTFFGVAGAFFYRAVNTLDARIGYHGKYEYLGKASARLDDLLNFIPARLTSLFLLLGGAMGGGDWHTGWKILRRDGGTTESPNAGRPMATMAGLLKVQLTKKEHYNLGDPSETLTVLKIDEALRILRLAALVGIFLCVGFWKVGSR